MSVDLDIQHYNLQDILSLFKVSHNFNEADLKRAKQMVLKTHPDKSSLPSEYFLFYSKAYKMLYSIWEFRKCSEGDVSGNTEYSNDSQEGKNILLNQFFESNQELKNKQAFNRWFNEQFEKSKVKEESKENGYGDWLKANDGSEPTKHSSVAAMKQDFDERKREARSLVIARDIEEVWHPPSMGASDLSNDIPGTYDSDLFSGLGFQDVYKAHTETLIPVTEEDYEKKQKFRSVNEFMSFRNTQDTTPLSELQAEQFLQQKQQKDEQMATRRAYELAKQTEIAKQKNNEFWSGIQLLRFK